MVSTVNQAGKSTREMAEKRRRKGILFGLAGIVLLGIILYVMLNPEKLGIGGGGLFILLVLVKVIDDFSNQAMKKQSKLQRRAVRGAKGEEKVGELLESLGEGYLIIHDIENPNGNIDHLVLSRTNGLFLIETKAHGGKVEIVNDKILVNGKDPEKDFIAQTLRNMYWLREKIQAEMGIKIWIGPIIVFTNAFVKFHPPVKGIAVTNKKYLLNTIQKSRKPSDSAQALWDRQDELVKLLQNTANHKP